MDSTDGISIPGNSTVKQVKQQAIRIRVQRASLHNAIGNGLYQRNILQKVSRLKTGVSVEANLNGKSDKIFYAPFNEQHQEINSEISDSGQSQNSTEVHQSKLKPGDVTSRSSRSSSSVYSNVFHKAEKDEGLGSSLQGPRRQNNNAGAAHHPTPTQFIHVNPTTGDICDLVYADEDFELSFIGMSVPPEDFLSLDGNELLMYSLRSHWQPDAESDDEDTEPIQYSPGHESYLHKSKVGLEHEIKIYSERQDLERLTKQQISKTTRKHRHQVIHGNKNKKNNKVEHHFRSASDNGVMPSSKYEKDINLKSADLPPQYPTASSKKAAKLSSQKIKQNKDVANDIPPTTQETNYTGLLAGDVPLIHFDPVEDGREQGTTPDTFVPLPASKSLYRQHRQHKSESSTIPVRFCIMEIDKVSPAQEAMIKGIDTAQKLTSATGSVIPYASLVSTAAQVASVLGKEMIRNYAKPDHVMSVDFEFMLANSHIKRNQLPYPQPYLRYGYYFFLAENVDAKLYAQTDSSQQNVSLLLKRHGSSWKLSFGGQREFFPLSGVAYVVMKVKPGITKKPRNLSLQTANTNRARLEQVLQVSDSLQSLSGI